MKKNLLISGLSLLLFTFLVFTGDFKNSVVFTGDEWEYQVIAVNHYYGNGFLTTGKIVEDDKYKLIHLDRDKLIFWESKSGKAYYRSPFYPFFLCLFYQIGGINPLYIKLFQLVLLFIAGLILILIAEKAWGTKGFKFGISAFILFILFNFRFAEHLMPENWQLVFISLIVYLLFFHYKGSPLYSVILGTILGISVLNKGTTFFVFPLVLICDAYLLLNHRKQRFVKTFLFSISFLLVTMSWSVYLSNRVHRPSFVSTQPKDVILDGNNEKCDDGLWHPEWRNDAYCYYNSEGKSPNSDFVKLVSFYYENPIFIKNLLQKIYAGFISLLSIKVLLSLFMANLSLFLVKYLESNKHTRKRPIGLAIYLLPFLIFPGSLFYLFYASKIASSILFLFSGVIYCILRIKKLKLLIELPFPFILIFLNFFIFTIVFYVCNEVYASRFVKTMEGVIILSVIYYAYSLSSMVLTGRKTNTVKNEITQV